RVRRVSLGACAGAAREAFRTRAPLRACPLSSFGVGRWALGVVRYARACLDDSALSDRCASDHGRPPFLRSASSQQVLSPTQAATLDRADRLARQEKNSPVSSTRTANGSKREES